MQSRFVKAFDNALQSERNLCYSDICTAIHTVAKRSLPLIRSTEGTQPIWMTDPAVRKARLQLEKHRRRRRNAEEAERALATVHKEQQLSAINEAIRTIDSTAPGKNSSACPGTRLTIVRTRLALSSQALLTRALLGGGGKFCPFG